MDEVTLAALLHEARIEHELIELGSPTRTAAEAAAVLGVPILLVVKSLVCMAARRPVLALVTGDRTLALPKLEAATGVTPVAMARGKDVKATTGYPVGAVAPLGHPSPLATYADIALRSLEHAYFGGGSQRHMLRLGIHDLERLTALRWSDLTEPAEQRDRSTGGASMAPRAGVEASSPAVVLLEDLAP